MAVYVIELASGMVHAIEAAGGPHAGVTGFIFSDEAGEVVAIVPHGVTIIRKDAATEIPVDEIEAAEQRGFERGRYSAPERLYERGPHRGPFDTMGSGLAMSEGGQDTCGTLAGATVPAADIDLVPGDGPIPPAAPLAAYEDEPVEQIEADGGALPADPGPASSSLFERMSSISRGERPEPAAESQQPGWPTA